jgi:hypothetical protein
MYRTPRSSHLISAWKQQIAMKGSGYPVRTKIQIHNNTENMESKVAPTLSEFLCTGEWRGRMQYHLHALLASQINPMGVADTFLRKGNMQVIIGDMAGMDDLPNVVACDILQIPSCNPDGKVQEAKIHNQR